MTHTLESIHLDHGQVIQCERIVRLSDVLMCFGSATLMQRFRKTQVETILRSLHVNCAALSRRNSPLTVISFYSLALTCFGYTTYYKYCMSKSINLLNNLLGLVTINFA